MNVLVSAAGRRVRLVQLFRAALREAGVPGRVHACDASPLAAALLEADSSFLTPAAADPEHVPLLLEACVQREIRLLVSVNDHELVALAEARDRFEEAGVYVAMMGEEAARIARDKRLTHAWLQERDYPVPRRWSPERLAVDGQPSFPVVVKPASGSAGIGVRTVADASELRSALAAIAEPVVEERETGQEFTVNVLASREGELVCAVPHLRLEVRAGEVSKGRTFRHPELERIADRLTRDLPRCRGPFNFQGFLTDGGGVHLTEINSRFGGGYPLAQAAGARFPEWLVREQLGERLPRAFSGWQEDVVMLRYDHEMLGREVAPGRIEPL